jgi:hypothetical protein
MKSRNGKAQSIIELVVGLIFIVPILLFLVDIGTIIIGVNVNDNVCREAARAASIGPPSAITSGEPKRRAELVVAKHIANGAVKMKPTVTVTEAFNSALPQAPFGGPIDGEVTIETQCDVHPPFLISTVVGPGGINFKARNTFPYTWIMPPT